MDNNLIILLDVVKVLAFCILTFMFVRNIRSELQ